MSTTTEPAGWTDRRAVEAAARRLSANCQTTIDPAVLHLHCQGWKGPIVVDLASGDVSYRRGDMPAKGEADLDCLCSAYRRHETQPTEV